MVSDLEKGLIEKAEKLKTNMRSKFMAGYHFARKFGFNSYEASVMKLWSKDKIIQLAKERGYQIDDKKAK